MTRPPHRPDDGPRPERLALLLAPLLVVVAIVLIVVAIRAAREVGRAPLPPPTASAEGYLFCTWNVENLFDDRDDPDLRDDDEDWFGQHPELVALKVDRLAEALLRLGDGRGPDILAIVEVENRRAAELLRAALNARLPSELHYTGLAHRDNRTGRRIEPALLTRLPLVDIPGRAGGPSKGRRKYDPRDFGIRRILEARVEVAGAPLTIFVSHWTSRVTDRTDEKRSAYAEALYDAVLDVLAADPAADVLLCGDFNDQPDDPSVAMGLRTVSDPTLVRASDARPYLLNLMAGRDPREFGTYFYSGRWQILDHIVVSPGLLDDRGWRVVPETLRVANDEPLRSHADRRPFRFGGPRQEAPRGYSDHFAVTVRLRVVPPARLQ